MEIRNRHVLVTGASRGIGEQLARKMLKRLRTLQLKGVVFKHD